MFKGHVIPVAPVLLCSTPMPLLTCPHSLVIRADAACKWGLLGLKERLFGARPAPGDSQRGFALSLATSRMIGSYPWGGLALGD